MRDYYEVLGVERSADADSIKKAYRKLAMQYHPDRNPGNTEAEDKFKEAASAYDILSNPEKRQMYDRHGHAAFQNGGRGGGGGFHDMDDIFSSFGDIFSDFFGGGGARSQRQRSGRRRGADLRYVCEISLKDVVQGLKRKIEFETDEGCSECSGSGAKKGTQPSSCETCGGVGQVRVNQGFFQMATTCPNCRGTGQMIKDPCSPCRGTGRAKKKRNIEITIPAGVDTGTRLRVGGEGQGGFGGGGEGDLYVEIHVEEDSRFQREGDDLYADLEVDYLQLLLGAEIEVETVTEKAKIEVPKGMQPGETLRMSGYGVPSLRGSRRGDLFFNIAVKMPKKVSKQEEELLRQIAESRGIDVSGSAKGSFFGRKK